MAGTETSPHQRLRTARIAGGHPNAKEFAAANQIPYTTYIAHESGKISISIKSAKKYAEILNIPSEWILHGQTEGMPPDNLTTSIHLRRKTLERIILPKVIHSILKLLKKEDETVDFNVLFKKAYIITSELLSKSEVLDCVDDAEIYINSILALSEEDLKNSILKK